MSKQVERKLEQAFGANDALWVALTELEAELVKLPKSPAEGAVMREAVEQLTALRKRQHRELADFLYGVHDSIL